jgi:hypothetical protein
MAERRPLVMVDGEYRQLPAGDTLPISQIIQTAVPNTTTIGIIVADNSVVVVDTLTVLDTLSVEGNLGVI